MNTNKLIYEPKNIKDIINLLEEDIKKIEEEIKNKNNIMTKLCLYKIYLEKIQNKE